MGPTLSPRESSPRIWLAVPGGSGPIAFTIQLPFTTKPISVAVYTALYSVRHSTFWSTAWDGELPFSPGPCPSSTCFVATVSPAVDWNLVSGCFHVV